MMRPLLDERQWRVLLGAEANAIGHGGVYCFGVGDM